MTGKSIYLCGHGEMQVTPREHLNDLLADALVRSLCVIMLPVFLDHVSQVTLAEEKDR